MPARPLLHDVAKKGQPRIGHRRIPILGNFQGFTSIVGDSVILFLNRWITTNFQSGVCKFAT